MQEARIYDDYEMEKLELVELWKKNKSPVAQFVEELQDTFNILINYRTGSIIKQNENKPYYEEISLRFVLNHEILVADMIYFDDRQLLVRVKDNQRIRKVSLKVIQEVQLGNMIIDFREKN